MGVEEPASSVELITSSGEQSETVACKVNLGSLSGQTEEAGAQKGGKVLRHERPSPPCPRCNSQETKFCYYNNYNVKQPRYFCKACQRYWTEGGMLRDVPVGAGRRKSKSSAVTSERMDSIASSSLLQQGSLGACVAALHAQQPAPLSPQAAPAPNSVLQHAMQLVQGGQAPIAALEVRGRSEERDSSDGRARKREKGGECEEVSYGGRRIRARLAGSEPPVPDAASPATLMDWQGQAAFAMSAAAQQEQQQQQLAGLQAYMLLGQLGVTPPTLAASSSALDATVVKQQLAYRKFQEAQAQLQAAAALTAQAQAQMVAAVGQQPELQSLWAFGGGLFPGQHSWQYPGLSSSAPILGGGQLATPSLSLPALTSPASVSTCAEPVQTGSPHAFRPVPPSTLPSVGQMNVPHGSCRSGNL